MQFLYGVRVFLWGVHYFSTERQTTWQMPGTDSPWKDEVGDSRAPVGAKTIFFHFPLRISVSRYPFSTEAEQPCRMVPADSRRITRVPRYSGYRYVPSRFT